ncbi:MAG: urea transporter [Gammaproteobacteria bacterium]|uniref:urea transporter n=1 Tax=Stutzerimonas xanthomarina TaxID=271420 RepID=UPI000EBF463D|nr:urea transporter [Stutzerimonas xanthomarina]MBU0813116.1 urea transporter [Gammaproteobacteria bacterium]HCC61358.1 transporter [Pseudomonas sp.]MBK3848037.1 urea transporter [Stutzerimonas xanthomarina]MBU0853015.1 urea transporter [Gammaproteobacteria bacterium]MBU1301130.1 urea transporter [Gammaproteobacteria bacterium]|tara:strand:+ start:19502 stop:20386 length:885 start_codon:yes stop_codon:yes gene_type:complete
MPPRFSQLLRSMLNGISQIFLQRHLGCGLLILFAIALHDLAFLAGALLGLLSGTLSAWRLGYPPEDIETGLYGYNAALLGLLITLMLGLAPLACLLIIMSGALSSAVQHHLLRRMRERRSLPGFTLSFVLLGWLAMGLSGALESVVEARIPEHQLDGWGALGGIMRGVGQVLFLADPMAGLCLFAALLLADRRAAVWTLCGSAVGIFMALLAGASEPSALAGLAGYNPALAALALSQVHRSALAPALGIGLAIIFRLFFDQLGLPPLTMPFILACWAVTLGKRQYQRQGELQPS